VIEYLGKLKVFEIFTYLDILIDYINYKFIKIITFNLISQFPQNKIEIIIISQKVS
jgi:hypothetical protein